MSSVSPGGFTDTVILAETGGPARGKPLPASGKILPAAGPADGPADARTVASAAERLGRALAPALRFEVDLDGGETVIYVLDRKSGDVIRRIPREEIPRLLTASGRFDLRLLSERL